MAPSTDNDPFRYLRRRAYASARVGDLASSIDLILPKIIAAFANGGFPTVMSSPPTTALAESDGNSTINGASAFAPSIMLTDPRLRINGPIALVRPDLMPTNVGYIPAWCSFGGGVYSGGSGFSAEFDATALSAFDISCSGWAASAYGLRIMVDGQFIGSSDIKPTFPGNEWAKYLKITFSGAANRKIKIFCTKDTPLVGINVNAGAVVSAPVVSPAEVKMICFSDSFGDAGGNSLLGAVDTFSSRLSFLFGQRFYPMGRSGQGYALQVDGRTINNRIPLDGPRVDYPDVVLLHGSVNDNAQTVAAMQANMADAVTQARTLWPKAWIVVLSSFSSTNAPINPTRNAAYYNGAMSVADSKTIVIDTNTIPLDIAASTGTLPNGAAHDSGDNVHWGPNEIAYNDSVIVPHVKARFQKSLLVYGAIASGTANVAFSQTWTTVNGVGAVTYALSGATLPSGLSFSTSTGAITGTTSSVGSTSGFVVTATDSVGNVFATPPFSIAIAAGAPLTTWDAANKTTTSSLSESNRRITGSGGDLGSRSTSSRASGKVYFEIEMVAGQPVFGIGNASALYNTWMAINGNGLAYDPTNGNIYSGGQLQGASGIGTTAAGNVVQVKLDRTAGTIQFGKANTFGNVFNVIPTGAQFIMATGGGSGASLRIRTEVSQFTYAVPSGYSAWN